MPKNLAARSWILSYVYLGVQGYLGITSIFQLCKLEAKGIAHRDDGVVFLCFLKLLKSQPRNTS